RRDRPSRRRRAARRRPCRARSQRASARRFATCEVLSWQREARSPELGLRVEGVLDAVAEQVERQHGDEQARPGKSMYHHWVSKLGAVSAIIAPQLGVDGDTPTPRNDNAASNKIVCGTIKLEYTRIGATRLGRIS